MIEAHEAGTDDFALAIEFVRQHAVEYGVDPGQDRRWRVLCRSDDCDQRSVCHTCDVAAVVAISGRMTLAAAKAYIREPASPARHFL